MKWYLNALQVDRQRSMSQAGVVPHCVVHYFAQRVTVVSYLSVCEAHLSNFQLHNQDRPYACWSGEGHNPITWTMYYDDRLQQLNNSIDILSEGYSLILYALTGNYINPAL